MKKGLLIFIFTITCGICIAKPKIISSEPCEYRDVSCDFFGYQKWFKEEVSYNQAVEDLDTLIYLLKSAYAGYDDAVNRGLEIDKIIDLFTKLNSENKIIKVSELNNFIFDYLKPYVQDCHFCIESRDLANNCVTSYRVLYTNVYVKKIDNYFVIEKSDNEIFKIGEKIECDNKNLFLYPSQGEDIYRIGTIATSTENEKEIFVGCSGITKQILCNISNNYLSSNNITTYKEIETDNSVYIYIPTLMDMQNNDNRKTILDENFKKLHSVSERYSDKKNIILDLRTNGGGNSLHTSKFLANLYFSEKDCTDTKSMKNVIKEMKMLGNNGKQIDFISPSIIQAENWLEKNIYSQEKNFINEFKKRRRILNQQQLRIKYFKYKEIKPVFYTPAFTGKVIILSGKQTASSGELAICEARSIFSKTNQFYQIGENSAGCFAYGNVWCYQLINSGIALHLPSFITRYSDICPEGLGIMPDYWAANDDILKALVNVTGDEKLFEKLHNINNNL